MQFLLLVALAAFALYSCDWYKTSLCIGLVLLSVVIVLITFAAGCLLSFVFDPHAMKDWTLPDAMVTAVLNSQYSNEQPWVLLMIPLLFAFDLLYWILYINTVHGNAFLWVCTSVAVKLICNLWGPLFKTLHKT